jgi:D-psicose/D-tagatose/L-ribulose 3-epimerase
MRFGVNSLLFLRNLRDRGPVLADKVAALGFDTFEVTPVDPDLFPARALHRRAQDLGLSLNANFALPREANTISP